MKISTKSRYGLRALVYIAEKTSDENEYVRIKDISEKEQISIQYLEQILFKLKKKGMISGKRGPNGGYKLGKSPSDIFVSDVFAILESDPKLALCDKDDCQNSDCTTLYLWNKLNNAIKNVINETSLQEIIDAHKVKKECREKAIKC